MAITRGTTPTLEFELPFTCSLLAKAYVNIEQADGLKVEKVVENLESEEDLFSIMLTQEETLQLNAGLGADIQVRVRTKDGKAFASEIIREEVDDVLRDGVI